MTKKKLRDNLLNENNKETLNLTFSLVVNIFTGDVIVTDFGDTPPMGNIQNDSLPKMLDSWLERPLAKSISCHCPAVSCLGPNLLVKDAYYADVDFTTRKANITR